MHHVIDTDNREGCSIRLELPKIKTIKINIKKEKITAKKLKI